MRNESQTACFFGENWGLTFSAVGGKICATEKSSAQKGDC